MAAPANPGTIRGSFDCCGFMQKNDPVHIDKQSVSGATGLLTNGSGW